MRRSLAALAFALSVPMFTTACDDACEELADVICACEPNQAEENSCQEAVIAVQERREANTLEVEVCAEVLETCTCDALARNDLVACGLAKRQ